MPRHTRPTLFDSLESRVLLSDDHANIPDFGDATPIPLSERDHGDHATYYSEWRSFDGEIEVADDTDLFSFTAPGDSEYAAFTVSQLDFGMLAPLIRLYNDAGQLITTGGKYGGVSYIAYDNQPAVQDGETYYVSVSAAGPNGSDGGAWTGRYALFIAMDVWDDEGTGGGDTGNGNSDAGGDAGDDADNGNDDGSGDDDLIYDPDDHAGRGAPHALALGAFDADADIAAGFQFPGDTDAYAITVPGSGPLRIQVLPSDPQTTTPDAVITLLSSNGTTRAVSQVPRTGALAEIEISAIAGEQLTIVVDSPTNALGDYTLDVDASPAEFRYFYPAGYSSPTIEEFIPMVNPNDIEVNYSIIAHYEFGSPSETIATGAIAPGARGGITVTSARSPGSSLTKQYVPYALEIVADAPLGANLGHYDFGATTGEAFTDTLSTRWEFPEIRREEGVQEFIVLLNPHDEPTTLRYTILDQDGVMHTFTRVLQGQRRGGINVSQDLAFPGNGVYALWVEADIPIVAAQTTYDVTNARGDGHLGQPDGGATAGALAGVSNETGVDARIAILNTSGEDADIRFQSPAFPGVVVVSVGARSQLTITPERLGLPEGQVASLVYTSDVPVSVRVMQFRHGDGDAAMAATEFAQAFLIGAAWVDPRSPGVYLEDLTLLNPNDADATVVIHFLFVDGTSQSSTMLVDGRDALHISVDQHPVIVQRGEPTAFSMKIESTRPIAAAFSHYDLFLDGGWGTLAAPLGLTMPGEIIRT